MKTTNRTIRFVSLFERIQALEAALGEARDGFNRIKKVWHDENIGCLAECSIACDYLARITEILEGK